MVESKLLSAILMALFWMRWKEKPVSLQKKSKLLERAYKEVVEHKSLLSLADKENIKDQVENEIQQCIEGEKLKDSLVIQYIEQRVADEHTKNQFIEIFCDTIVKDKIVSTKELESIHIIARSINVEASKIDEILAQKKKSKDSLFAKNEHVYSSKQKAIFVSSAIFGVVFLIMTVMGGISYFQAKNAFSSFNLQDFVEQKPKLVFKRMEFAKFIIHGSPTGTNKHTDRLNVFHVKGSADFEFDMAKLSVNKEKTDYVSKTLVLDYADTNAFPIQVNVNIPQENINLVHETSPQPFTESEAKKFATAAAGVATPIGAYFGAKLGADVGNKISKIPLVGGLIGGGLGGLLGGASAGGSAYLVTKNFISGLEIAGNSLGDKEKVLNQAKPMIALELMGGSMLDKDSWKEDVKAYYQTEFVKQMTKIMRNQFGWQKVETNFGGAL